MEVCLWCKVEHIATCDIPGSGAWRMLEREGAKIGVQKTAGRFVKSTTTKASRVVSRSKHGEVRTSESGDKSISKAGLAQVHVYRRLNFGQLTRTMPGNNGAYLTPVGKAKL